MATSTAFKYPEQLSKLVAGNTEFAFDIYSELAKKTKGNVFFSPISISVALAMTYLGAKKSTASEMKNTMKLALLDDIDMHFTFGEMTKFLQTDASSSFTLNTANKIFARKDYSFLKEFLDATKKYYQAEAENLDFAGDSEGSRKMINQWVEEQTARKIKDLMPGGSVNHATAMVLVNAIYFKGNWKDKFETRATRPGDFKLGGGNKVKVDMMFSNKKRNYGENPDLDCKIVELPYVNEDLSFFIVLPNKNDGVLELASKLDAGKLYDLTSQMENIDVDLHLPKFKLEDMFNLNNVLQNLGMKEMFIAGKADFSGMDGSNKLFVSDVVHKSFLDVNEEGSEAAAATGISIMLMCMPITMEFNADHPFIFFIRDNRTKGVLFMGRLVQPN